MVSWKRARSKECDAGEMQAAFPSCKDNSRRQGTAQLSVSFVYRILHSAVCPIVYPV